MNTNVPTCLQALAHEHGPSETLSEDVPHLKAKQDSVAIQLQSMVTQLQGESLGPHRLGERGKDVAGSPRDLWWLCRGQQLRLWTLGSVGLGWPLNTAS